MAGHILDKKRTRIFYEKEALSFDHQKLMYVKGEKQEIWWHRKRAKYIFSFLKETHAGQQSFLDLGCAEGYYMSIVANSFEHMYCVGVDIAVAYIKKAKKNVGRNGSFDYDFVVCDAENLPFKWASFDVVLCSEVLEHIFDYHKALCEIYRVACRRIILSFPGQTFIGKLIGRVKPLHKLVWRSIPDVGHVSAITIEDIESFVKTHEEHASSKIEIGGIFPVQLYKILPSAELIDIIDNAMCKILKRLNAIENTTIRVIQILKNT